MRSALAGMLLLVTVLAGAAGEAQADVLISNANGPTTLHSSATFVCVDVSTYEIAGAQKFTTGTNAAGYALSSVDVYIADTPSLATPKVSIYTAGSDGNPGTSQYTLTNPASFNGEAFWGTYDATAFNTFTAANATLDPNTDYFVVFENTGTQTTVLQNDNGVYSCYDLAKIPTYSGEDSGGAAGWSIFDHTHRKLESTNAWTVSSGSAIDPLRLKIEGTVRTVVDTTAPTLDTATVDGNSLVLTYNEPLDTSSRPATSAYAVSVAGGAGVAPSSVAVSGMTVTLTLATTVTAGQTVTVTYTVPASNPVQDEAGNDAAALTNQSVTNNTNAPPVFADSIATRSIAETAAATTVQTAATIGAAFTATDTDNDTLTYTLQGVDAGKFSIVSGASGGQITTKVGQSYDYEAKTSYMVTVHASDRNGGSATIAVTINVTNTTTETPLAPAAPAVTATSGSTTSLDVTWTAPVNTGRPAITSYDLQYRKGTSGIWTNGPQDQTGTSASISSLDANSEYQVQVRATNADGDSPWSSPPGSGRTANNAPVFTDGASTTRSIAETVGDATVQTAANIGDAIEATDANNDRITYSLEGMDAGKFTIVSTSGQLRTKVDEAYDREAKASYRVTVKASDGTGSDTIAVTITVTNETEKPLAPAAPTVTTTAGSSTSLDVTWTVSNKDIGRPAITSYDLQYRKGMSGPWTNGPQDRTGTSASIASLDGNSAYQVQMRATNADGDSDWSSPGSGSTANNQPVFADDGTTRSITETVGEATVETAANIGASVTATDPENDTITYSLEGTDAGKFSIVSGVSGGQITTKGGQSYDYEALPDMKKSYAVTVKASDGTGSDVITVTINVTNNTTETPLAPAAPAVTATAGVTMTVDVTWTAPSNTGRPAITNYDLQYRKGPSGNWTDGPQGETGTSASITGLDGNATYQVRVRANNADGDGAWSSPGSGETTNTPPAFANDGTVRSFAETVGDETVQTAADIGVPVTATDPDNDTLTYTLEGTDAASFTIVPETGQLTTKVGEVYNYEATTSYAVTVKADDRKEGGTDTIDVTLTVTNVTEFVSARVTTSGVSIDLEFIEALSTTPPPISALTVTVDGEAATVQSVRPAAGTRVSLSMVNRIRQGQTVTVSYADPTTGNDPEAIQDEAGNDAHSFTDQPVENPSTLIPHDPTKPTGLTATANGPNRIDLSWTAPVDNGGRVITGYQIQESPDGRTTGLNVIWNDVVADTGDSNTTYTESDLSPGTTRYYQVFAINSVATSSEGSNVATETTPTTNGTPSPPRNLKSTAIGKTKIDLSWDPPGDEGNNPVTGYKIEVSEDGGNNWTDLVASQTATTYEHMELSPETTYAYRVFAINSMGPSAHNSEADGRANAMTFPLDAPNAPENLRAIPGDRRMTLIWEPPAEIDPLATLTGYDWKVHFGNIEKDWNPALGDPACNPCQRTMPGLQNGQAYTFYVRAVIVFHVMEGRRRGQGLHGVPAEIEARPAPRRPSATPGDRTPDDEMLGNTPPMVAIPLVDQTATVGVAFTYGIPEDAFTDADGDPLAYTAGTGAGDALPMWLTFTAATGTFTGTPEPSDGGTMNLTVTASDGIAAVSDDFALTVLVAPPVAIRSWTARFGRTVGTHVTDAIGQRLREAVDSHVTVGNYRLPLGQQPGDAAEPEARQPRLTLGPSGTRWDLGEAGTGQPRPGSVAPDPWTDQPEADPRMDRSQTLRLRDLLMGSSFRLRLGGDDAQPGAMNLTAWGRMAGTQFSGRDQAVDVAVDGDVLTGTLGVDGAWDRWLAGVAVSHSQGDGSFTLPEIDGTGELENSLTSLHPYLRYAVNNRLDVWGVLGYGWGNLTLKPVTGGTLETDTNLMMGSFGGRGILRPALENGGFELATRTDAMFTRLSSEAVAGLAAVDADAHRLRVVLEGSRPVTWPEGQSVTPSMEVGVRHDWGDAETGFGLELGGRVQYADPGHGLTIEAAVRGLLAHEDSDYEEWGASGTIRIDPGPMGQGLALTLSPAWGAASSGVDGLWSRQTTAGLAPQGGTQAQAGRLNAQIGYGLWLPSTGGLVTPFTGVAVTDGDGWRTRAGLVFDRPGTWGGGLRVELAGESNATAVGQSEQTIGLQLQVTFGSGRRGAQSDNGRGGAQSKNGRGGAQSKNGRGAKARSTPVPSPPTPDGVVTGPRPGASTRAGKGRHRAAVRPHATAQSPAWLQKTPPVSALDRTGGRQYVVQLGMFSDHADAIKARTELALDLSDILHHTNRPLTIVASKKDGLLRVVVAQAFPIPEAAAALCAAIQTRGPACSVTAVWPVPGRAPPGRRVAEARGVHSPQLFPSCHSGNRCQKVLGK